MVSQKIDLWFFFEKSPVINNRNKDLKKTNSYVSLETFNIDF